MALEYRSFIAQDGAEILYVDQGVGRPLIFVEGFRDIVDSSQAHIARWSENFRCVLFDHRGYGKSPIASNVGIEQSARDLHELLEYLDVHDAALVGYSMGGSVAFSYFQQFGNDRIGRLVLVDTTPKLINEDGWSLGLWQGRYTREDFDFDMRMVVENPVLFHMSFYLHAALQSPQDAPPTYPPKDDTDAWLAAIVEHTGLRERLARRVFYLESSSELRELEQKYWKSMTGGDWLSAVSQINVPTMCLYASPGSFYAPRTGEWLAREIPNARLEIVENSTHLMPKDNFEEFVTKIAGFCAE